MTDNSKPQSAVGRFAKLKVLATQRIGAYLDWGCPEELFLPFRDQVELVSVGEEIVVFIYVDEFDRPLATMHLDAHFDLDTSSLQPRQKVELLLIAETKIGYQAIIDGRWVGVLYKSEVFQELEYGAQITAYVKHIRDDRKVDLILQRPGLGGATDLGREILDKLRDSGGFMALTDKTTPEVIYATFSVSKKKFKEALGGLFKRQMISLDPDGIRLKTK
jgi:predicted RNA-binding protein (virulence factor B family)